MDDFAYESPAGRVVFGAGSLDRVAAECAALGLRRVLVIAGGSARAAGDRAAARLGPAAAGQFTEVAPHVPEPLAQAATAAAAAAGADGVCSVGGGSATGLAKAVAVATRLPVVAVPTTYAGSEATAVYGITSHDSNGARKRTATDPHARPRTVLYDPSLTTGLPAAATASSGLNALAHAAAALTGVTRSPIATLYAREAAQLLAQSLPVAVTHPDDLEARGRLLWAAWLAGSALAASGTGLHHRLCHVLGGSYGLSHAPLHAVLLPHTLAHDPALAPAGLATLASALGRDDPARAVRALALAVAAPSRLTELGLPPEQFAAAAGLAAESVGGQPASWFKDLLERADSTHGADSAHDD